MYTIEDFKQGKCAVSNDGTVDELNKILSFAKWPFQASGSERYYWIDLTGANCGYFIPDLPIQSVKDFIKQLNIKMGDKATKEESLKEFTFSEDDIPNRFPYHPFILDQGIQERCSQYKESPKEAFDWCKQHSINYWFSWEAASQGKLYWGNIYDNPNFILKNYIPKYFKSKFSNKDIKKELDYNYNIITKSYPSKDNFTIPISYKEVKLDIKKPICKF